MISDGVILLLVVVVAIPLALLAAYLHSRRLGWDAAALATAPEAPDPDADKRQDLADLLHDELGVDISDSDVASLLRSISHIGYDVVKRGE